MVGASDGGACPFLQSAEKAIHHGQLAQLRPTVNLMLGQDPDCLQWTEHPGVREARKPSELASSIKQLLLTEPSPVLGCHTHFSLRPAMTLAPSPLLPDYEGALRVWGHLLTTPYMMMDDSNKVRTDRSSLTLINLNSFIFL